MNETVIDNLVIEISTESGTAGSNIDIVTAALNRLNATNGRTQKTASVLSKLSRAIKNIAVTEVLGNAVRNVNEYVENINLFTMSMGGFADEAMAYAQRVQDVFGVDMSEFIRNQAIFKNMADGFGLAEDQAYQLSKGLTELAYDISSLYNVDMETTFQRLQSGVAGEIEPVRRWGIALDQASMKQWLLKKGIDANVSSMTQADKALVRYNMMVETMAERGAIGDLARTLETPANSIRILQQQITQLSRAIGSLFIPVLVKVIPYIRAFVKVVTEAAQALANLLGINIDFSVDYSGLTTGVGVAADAMDDAAASAKKLKDYTMGFDELNIINPNTGAGAAQQTGLSGLDMEAMSVWDESIFAGIDSQVDQLTGKMKVLLGVVLAVGTAFAAWKIGTGIVAAINALKGPLSTIWGMLAGKAMVPTSGQAGLFGVLTQIAKYKVPIAIIAVAITAVSLALVDLWKNSETFRNKVTGTIDEVKAAFVRLKNAVWNNLVTPIMDALGITASSFGELYSVYIRPIVEQIASVLVDILGGAIIVVIDFFTGFVTTVGTAVGNILTFIGNFVTAGVTNITTFKDQFVALWEEIKGNVASLKETMTTTLDNVFAKIKGVWGDIKTWFTKNVAPKLTLEYWLEKFANIKESFVTTIKNAINSAISLVNRFISWLNDRMHFSWDAIEIAGQTIVPAGSVQLFTIPTIPMFKDGGFLEDGLFTMNHGEIAGKFSNGQSVVANNQQIVDGIAQGVYEAFTRANSDSEEKPVQVNVYLDGKQISKSVDKYNNSRGRVIMGNGLGYNF